VPRQLPADFATFTGRADQLSMLDGLVAAWDADPARRTVVAVVDGAGGMGKTAMAVHWGHRAGDWFPDGQLYVNLRGYGPGTPVDPSVAAGAMLGALAVPDEQIPADPDARSGLLRTRLADRRVLLLLDNARDTEQVRALLPGSSAFVIVTSRSQLRGLVTREGARRLTVAEMSETESVSVLEHAGGSAATSGGDAAREVARLCAGVPLALAVAAERLARAAGGRVDQVLEDLRDEQLRLDALSAGGDQSTDVRAVLSWSYQAVNDDEARLFRLLGVAPGLDVSTAGAAALVGGSEAETRRLLDRLVDAHLLLEKTTGRFEQHDLIRVYAAELAAGEADADREDAQRRVWSWYHGTAVNACRELSSHQSLPPPGDDPGVDLSDFDDRAAAVAWFHAEHANLAEVVREAAEAGSDVLAWQAAKALGTYFTTQRPWDHPISTLERGLACARRAGDRYGEGMLLASLGDSHHFRQNYVRSLALSRQALAAFQAVGNSVGEVGMLANIGMTLTEDGQLDAAIKHYQLAVAACAALDDPRAEALVLGNLAAAYNSAGRHDDAIETAGRALRVSRAADLPEHAAHVLDELGAAHSAKGEHRTAVAYFHEALELYRATDHPYEVLTLDHLAEAHRAAGDAGMARETWRRALALATDSGHPYAARIEAQLAAL
jgi:tetratricopeptide (TPR) repeat protein